LGVVIGFRMDFNPGFVFGKDGTLAI